MATVPFHSLVLAGALVLAAPTVVVAQAQLPATPIAAVEEFMRAASDSNLTRMAQLFGTDRGPAASTNVPKDHGQRMVIMQAYLQGISVRALGEVGGQERNRRMVTTEISRGPCRVTVPVTAVQVRGGWIVNSFDLTQVAEVNKPCENSPSSGNPGR